MNAPPKIELRNIRKTFPGVVALGNVNFAVRKGSVHVLCGENGAGKSTLMKVLNGIYKADQGEILIDGQKVEINNPIEAAGHGIAMIFQELNFVPEMTVEENLFLGYEPTTKVLGRVDWKAVRRQTMELIKREKLPYSPTIKLRDLSVSDIQLLEITKAISRNADVIIMDEPTSAITNREVEHLLERIGQLKAQGISIIYISHKMEEIFRIADDVTVIRDGSVVATRPAKELNIDQVIAMMVGRELTNVYPKEDVPIGDVIFEAERLNRAGTFHDVSFNVRAGEIVGFAGLVGAGRTEVARAVFGLDPFDSGTIRVEGKDVRVRAVRDSLRSGVAMLSEDRRRYGIVPMRSVGENASLGNLAQFIYGGFLHAGKEKQVISERFAKMAVKTPSLDTAIQNLSGGNQQKVLIAKWLLADPRILFMDEPTRGIDVGAKLEIYKLMTGLAREGKGLVMISSELPELLGMCDRIYVMSRGRIRGELTRDQFSQEEIMKLATMV